ncbi:uncharacterized protein LOC125964873 isoform X2 [Orcinus orca]|uniref:uncharacterized protein LOC125964873 isoform X2 n=2 Tax=Delphinidae TaxID=9726 RepID=UPI002111562E|nr:uncharacterized protein LOC125964873 isoform X2 [Orcinus orca]XP_049567539.1 uncharacterized protein LOC125964873 isoform X2 [Orcinus orca]XP_049567541.1 uncharacterized protein LOC125964873 isoform X2 [Orcinus orca]
MYQRVCLLGPRFPEQLSPVSTMLSHLPRVSREGNYFAHVLNWLQVRSSCCFWCLPPWLSSWRSALDLAPPLRVGHLRVCFLHPGNTGLKEQLLRGLWLTQAGGRVGYGVRGEPAAAEASVMLHQPEACRAFSRGSCPWNSGPWQWWAAKAPRRGSVDSGLCFHTGFLVAAAAALASYACLWGPR